MRIKLTWSIEIEDSTFTGSANMDSFDELDTLLKNLKVTKEIVESNHNEK